jgi:glycosyltransferase involved in cell wall biosynthesis
MPDFLARCDVGVIAYGRDLGERSLPNRLFEYMAAGLAVLAPSYAVDIRQIVEEEGIGRTADFEKPEEVAEAMRWFSENRRQTEEMGRLARKAFLERHNWDAEFDRLTEAMGAERR